MPIFFIICALAGTGLTAFLYWLGLEEFFFWQYPWFDIPLHMVGGLTISMLGSAVAWRQGYSRYQAFFFIIFLAFGIGAVWEIFEYVSGLTVGEAGYWFDTLKDLGDNVIGALIGWGFYSLFRFKKTLAQ